MRVSHCSNLLTKQTRAQTYRTCSVWKSSKFELKETFSNWKNWEFSSLVWLNELMGFAWAKHGKLQREEAKGKHAPRPSCGKFIKLFVHRCTLIIKYLDLPWLMKKNDRKIYNCTLNSFTLTFATVQIIDKTVARGTRVLPIKVVNQWRRRVFHSLCTSQWL